MRPELRSSLRSLILVSALLCTILLAAFGVSMFLNISWTSPGLKHTLVLSGGALTHDDRLWLTDGYPPPQAPWARLPPAGWSFAKNEEGLRFGPWERGKSGFRRTGCSLLTPLLLLGLPTALLWWRQHRARPGHCRSCGYDLTGNTSGQCPECGLPASSSC